MSMTQDELHRMPWTLDQMDDDELREWLTSRKAAAAKIHIETCELGRWAANDADPYGIREALGEFPEEMWQLGTNRFVRSPDSGGCVHEGDLSLAQGSAMYDRIRREYRAREAAKSRTGNVRQCT